MKKFIFGYTIGLLLCLMMVGNAWAKNGVPLFVTVSGVNKAALSSDPTVKRSRLVGINVKGLSSDDEPTTGLSIGKNLLTLNLFDDVTVTASKTHAKPNFSGSKSWVGRVKGKDKGEVILVSKDGVLTGNIRVGKTLYQVRYVGNGVHAVYEIDQTKFPDLDCHPDTATPVSEKSDGSLYQDEPVHDVQSATADSSGTIDVMVVYTAAARSANGGTTGITNLIDLAVTETNQGYTNSGVSQSLNLVHTAEITYTESGNIQTDRNRLQNSSDGYMDTVHSLRNTYKADIVSLVVDNGGGYCGIAYIMENVSTSFENYAFNVVADNCATGYYSFGHELGHIMGARHDWYVDDTVNSPYSYNHGFFNAADGWRTIMSYNNGCSASGGCTRINYWSNPSVSYGGDPMGVAGGTSTSCNTGESNPDCDADNERTLDNTDYTVSNFRQRSSSDDAYEENDTQGTAYNLSNLEQQWLDTISGSGMQADEDWYEIYVTPNYQKVLIDCRFTDADGDIDIALYDASGVRLASSTSVSDNEYIDYTVSSGGTYYIKVYYGDAGNSYNLWWDDIQP